MPRNSYAFLLPRRAAPPCSKGAYRADVNNAGPEPPAAAPRLEGNAAEASRRVSNVTDPSLRTCSSCRFHPVGIGGCGTMTIVRPVGPRVTRHRIAPPCGVVAAGPAPVLLPMRPGRRCGSVPLRQAHSIEGWPSASLPPLAKLLP